MDGPIEARIATTTTAVIWLSAFAAGLSLAFSVIMIWFGGSDPLGFFTAILPEFDFPNSDTPPTTDPAAWQGVAVASLWMLPDLWGCFLFLRVRRLFLGIRARGVFQSGTADGVWQVGWILTLLAAVLLVCETLTAMALSYFAFQDGVSVEVSLEDTHLYCVIIGLVIMALGRVMVDATRLSEENRAFV